MKKFTIFIDVRGFWNRGDQLMVQSALDQIQKYRPNAVVAVRKDVFDLDTTYWTNANVHPLNSYAGIKRKCFYSFPVNFLRRRMWMVQPSKVDLVLICRGFYISDYWNDEYSYMDEVHFYELFSNPETKFVCLPQAFGPFDTCWSRKLLAYVWRRSSLLFARDGTSFRYLRNRYPDSDKIKMSPDFTCLLQNRNNGRVRRPEGKYVVVILNARMIDKTERNVSVKYLAFMRELTEYLINRGKNVILLNFEGDDDERLLQKLNGMLPVVLPLYTRLHGTDAKYIIAGAELLISSRFHGAVSGLTQAVPTLCTSWSHKYVEMLKEMECEHCLLDVMNTAASVSIVGQAINNPEGFVPPERLRENYRMRAENMWSEVMKQCH